MVRRLLLLLALAACLPAPAAQQRSWQGTVTHVSDGDTVWVRPSWGAPPVSVRLHGLDAPETCQPYGEHARTALRQRLLHQPVLVEERGRDDYRRTLARLRWSGQDVGAWLVFNGLAWSYRYRQGPGPYDPLQAQARQARRGLWAQAHPLEPRRFRRLNGPCEPAAGR